MDGGSCWAVWARVAATVCSNVQMNAAYASLEMMIEDDFVLG